MPDTIHPAPPEVAAAARPPPPQSPALVRLPAVLGKTRLVLFLFLRRR